MMDLRTGPVSDNGKKEPPLENTDLAVITAMLYHRFGCEYTRAGATNDLGLLPLHCERLLASMKALGWNTATESIRICFLQRLQEAIEKHDKSQPPVPPQDVMSYKLNINVLHNGDIHVRSAPLKRIPDYQYRSIIPDGPPFCWSHHGSRTDILVDDIATDVGMYMTHKTTRRAFYNAARDRASVGNALPTDKDVLLCDRDGNVLETSCSTVYFTREGNVVTPKGGNQGVTRRLALERLGVQTSAIKLDSLKEGEEIWLSNAVRGFFPGRVVTPQSRIDEVVARIKCGIL